MEIQFRAKLCATIHRCLGYPPPNGHRTELLDLARAAKEKGWWRAYGIEDRGYVDLETEACTVRELSLMHIPGLLQTEEYMRAVISSGRLKLTKKRLENDVTVRLIRQQRLTDGEHPLHLTAIDPTGSIHVEKAAQVREASLVFEHLLSQALPAEDSAELVERVAGGL